MAASVSQQSPRASTRRSRKSIAHFPGVSDKENNTISGMTSSTIAKTSRKTRSKSMGPGGLEVLNETTGNSQKVRRQQSRKIYQSLIHIDCLCY